LIMIIAHRGYKKEAKENTIAAFDAAFKSGADAIETDVRLTKDNQAVVNHDDKFFLEGKDIVISQTPLSKILELRGNSDERILTLDGLFNYIARTKKEFFIELKSNNPKLAEQVAARIEKHNLWESVNIIGFFNNIKSALRLQARYPALRVCQLIMLPMLSYLFKPKKSYAVFIGWLDGVKYSQQLFRLLISPTRLRKLKQYYQNLGFKVYGGVINRADGWRYFHEAGIDDIFTDETSMASEFYKL